MSRPTDPATLAGQSFEAIEGAAVALLAKAMSLPQDTSRTNPSRISAAVNAARSLLDEVRRAKAAEEDRQRRAKASASRDRPWQLGEAKYYQRLLKSYHQAAESAEAGTVAHVHALKAAESVRQKLDALAQSGDGEDLTTMSQEEFLRRLEDEVSGWPEEAYRTVFGVYERLRRVRLIVQAEEPGELRLVSGDDVDDG